jgi:hypothetical protein
MKIQRCLTMSCALMLLHVLLMASFAAAEDKKKDDQSACSNPNPASLCNADNTCGSASTPCSVDVKRTSNSSSATPSLPGAKGNSLFCVKTGTTVTWMSSSKDTGFLIDFGASSPFDPPGTVTGGSAKAVSVVAKTPGCVKYNLSATAQNAIYGKSKAAQAELIVISGQ